VVLGDWDYDVHKFAAYDLKVAVYYGNVANLTFTSDFILPIAGSDDPYVVNNLITLLFVKAKGEWKIVHEHHSPVSDDWERPEPE
jgi:ketosteroid isomerase-like protein